MASKYDDLDPRTELEQQLREDLKAALKPRGCEVIHHGGSGGTHSPGGKPDLEVRDPANRRLILVEATKRTGAAADGEFPAITAHLSDGISEGGYDDYCLFYVSPATSPRMSANIRDLYNRGHERDDKPGRIVALDFAGAQLMLEKLATSDPALYPAERFGELFSRWEEAVDDARARQLVQRALFPEDHMLALELTNEAREIDAERERRLKDQLSKVEDEFRNYGITGDKANETLVYLAFIRLYEERRQRLTGRYNRFTQAGFTKWAAEQPAALTARYKGRMVEALLHEIAEDSDLAHAGLLRGADGEKDRLHPKMSDSLVGTVLEVFDQYDFHAGRVDVLGAVFETLARRSQKDTRVGQFFTPEAVVNFCTDLVELRATDVVGDLAVGTGRFLIAAMRRMLAKADELPGALEDAKETVRQRLLGCDIDDWVSTIAKMNMFIHGDGKAGIVTANGLALADRALFDPHPHGIEGQLDVVLMNPPLGDTSYTVAAEDWATLGAGADEESKADFLAHLGVVPMRALEEAELEKAEQRLAKTDARIMDLEALDLDDRSKAKLRNAYRTRARQSEKVSALKAKVARGEVTRVATGRSMKGGALFLGAVARYLKRERDERLGIEWRGGRVALIVDEAILNTPEYGRVRKFIRDHFYVKAVISLARDGFVYLAHTDAKTSILYLAKKPESGVAQKEPIFFAHADRIGYGRTGDWVGDDLPQILVHYRVFQNAVLNAYSGAYFDRPDCMAAIEALPGFSHAVFARLDEGEATARLDFYDARYRQRVKELEESHGELETIGTHLEVAAPEPPAPSRTGEYEFAAINRVTASLERKGVAEVKYRPRDLWVVRDGDLVVSGIDLVHGAVAVAPTELEGLVMSKEMYQYRVRENSAAVPEYLQLLLRTPVAQELIMGLVTGTSNRTRLENPEQLLGLPIPPLPDRAKQEEAAAKVREAHELRRAASLKLHEAHDGTSSQWRQPSRPEPIDPRKLPVAEGELV